jgi:signal transduction histidine kinase
MLDNIGLAPTLEWYTGEFTKRTGIKINFVCQGTEANLPGKLRITAYRVIQESLTNTARYSGAKEAFIRVQFRDDAIRINIEDQGSGFDISKVPINSSGIRGMRERALSMNGSLEITSAQGKGTQIELILPIQK